MSPSLTVYFVGLCTHLTKSSSGVVPHRVVLVNAGRDRLVNGRLVRKHRAMLRFRQNPGLDLPLDGMTIKVNAASSKLEYAASFDACIPRLRSFTGSALPPLSAQMVTHENPDLVSAYFDASGTFSAGRNKQGAAIGILQVETIDAPKLTLDPFEGEPKEIELPQGAIIQLENVDPTEDRATDHDFLLHYKLFVSAPSDADWPRQTSACTLIEDPELSAPAISVGPGCSNSNYP